MGVDLALCIAHEKRYGIFCGDVVEMKIDESDLAEDTGS